MNQKPKEIALISAGTTVRNPDRLIKFFNALLNIIEDKVYSKEIQHDIQTVLIQTRDYGYGNTLFYKTLKQKYIDLLESDKPLSFDEAKEIYLEKMKTYKIKDGIRGRTSIASLNKFGFFYTQIGEKILASEIGKKFLNKEISETLFFQKILLKWQFGSKTDEDYKEEDGYNIKPFVAFLHLLSKINKKFEDTGKKPVGINMLEFDLFIPTLINYKEVDDCVDNIINFREKYAEQKNIKDKKKLILKYYENFSYKFNVEDKNKKKFINNLSEYGQNNLLLYYLKTDLIEFRGKGNYIDIKRDIREEYIDSVKEICQKISPKVDNFETYKKEFQNFSEEIEPKLSFLDFAIKKKEAEKIQNYLEEKNIKDIKKLKDFNENIDLFKEYLDQIVDRNKFEVFEKRIWTSDDIKETISGYLNIRTFADTHKWIEYERLGYWSMLQLNDHKLIKPNFPINEEGYPKKKGPPGIPDIECFYQNFALILEVTLKTQHDQWQDETASILEHLEKFIDVSDVKENFCLFISPKIHPRALGVYFSANKTGFGSDKKLGIIPLAHDQFCKILQIQSELLKDGKKIESKKMYRFYKDIHLKANSLNNKDDWAKEINTSVNNLVSEYTL